MEGEDAALLGKRGKEDGMPEDVIVRQGAPTLAGIKTGSLFCCPVAQGEDVAESVREMNARLVPRGARMIPLRRTEESVLLYVYRPRMLRNDLQNALAAKLLTERVYPVESSEKCVAELARRMNAQSAFPHEIGLFLGYPPEDVDGFIRCRAQGAKCVGTWKVYGDVDAAKKKFALYQKCARLYQKAYGRHQTLDRLIVSCS